MKVFISWSGPKSKVVALALHEWIPRVIQEAQTFMSADSIESGQRWSGEIAAQLDSTNFGVICTTAANQFSPWLNFEAGALAKKLIESRVAPLAIDLAPSEIQQPLGQFNGDPLTEAGVRRLVHSMNKAADKPLDLPLLDSTIDVLWPILESSVSDLPDDPEGAEEPVERTERDILLEVLDSVRGIVRAQGRETVLKNPSAFRSFRDFTDHYGGLGFESSGASLTPLNSLERLRFLKAAAEQGERAKWELAEIQRQGYEAELSMQEDREREQAEEEAIRAADAAAEEEEAAIAEALRENGEG